MKLNEKNVANFALCSSPVDKEGYLQKRGETHRVIQRRWFVLKGNLLFYFEKKQDKEPMGVIILEHCSVQLSIEVRHAFEIVFDGPGSRAYLLIADSDDDMQSWMRSISHASYEYLKTIVLELQRRVNDLTSNGRDMDEEGDQTMGKMSDLHLSSSFSYAKGSASTVTTKVENGIVVDVESVPPVPRKTRSKASLSSDAEPDAPTDDGGVPPVPHKQRTSQRHSIPHSSPLVVLPYATNTAASARAGGDVLLGANSYLPDTTAVMQPTSLAGVEGSASSPPPESTLSSTSRVATSSMPGDVADQPLLYPVGYMATRQMASPMPDQNLSILEMHERFQRSVRELYSDKTNTTGSASN